MRRVLFPTVAAVALWSVVALLASPAPGATRVPAATAVTLAAAVSPTPDSAGLAMTRVLGDDLVRRGYDQSNPPWRPPAAKWLQLINPVTVAADLLKAIGKGIDDAFETLGTPPAIRIPAPKMS